MSGADIIRHYLDARVSREIVEYSRDKWIALELSSRGGRRIFIRHWRKGIPLRIRDNTDYRRIIYRYRDMGLRTFYASINTYNNISGDEDVSNIDNIAYSSPVWDIDGSLKNIELTKDAARIILDELERNGVYKSVFLVWSGRGIHIHIHEKAFSPDVRSRIHPLDISYAIVEYIIGRCWARIRDLASGIGGLDREFRVENKIDIQRVFTVPLSIHREYDIVAVCIDPGDLDGFTLEWTRPGSFKSSGSWRMYVEGEGDELALRAFKEVGGYIASYKPRRRGESIVKRIVSTPIVSGNIGRFQVMALLQAARYYLLTGDLDKAKSFGLNRAIFYAWAKYYKGRVVKAGPPTSRATGTGAATSIGRVVNIGDERVYVGPGGYYIIGDREQYPEDYDRQVAEKISRIVDYRDAWEAALDYLRRFPETYLRRQRDFYEEVYKPVRDTFNKVIQEYIAYKRVREGQD